MIPRHIWVPQTCEACLSISPVSPCRVHCKMVAHGAVHAAFAGYTGVGAPAAWLAARGRPRGMCAEVRSQACPPFSRWRLSARCAAVGQLNNYMVLLPLSSLAQAPRQVSGWGGYVLTRKTCVAQLAHCSSSTRRTCFGVVCACILCQLVALFQAWGTCSLPSNKQLPNPYRSLVFHIRWTRMESCGAGCERPLGSPTSDGQGGQLLSASRLCRWQTCGALCLTCTEPCC